MPIKLLLISSLLFTALIAEAAPDARVSVQSIEDRSAANRGSCEFGGIWSTPGEAVRELLISELQNSPGVTLLEREHISSIYEEEMRSENLDQSTVAEKKKFIAANYAIAGVISEFEWCVSGGDTAVDIGGLLGIGELSVAKKSSKAHVAVDLRLIEVKTGKILGSFRGEGQTDESGLGFGADAFGVRIAKSDFEKTPLGKATSGAVSEAARKIVVALNRKN